VIASILVKAASGILTLELVPERLNQNVSLEQWSLEECAPVVQEITGLELAVTVQQ
jgi:exopolyphosphatase/guanosine-5'-triphosphate,3'-diphosphate pyrophosphatase